MSANTDPITPARFAAALKELSIGSLHAKAAEIQNSINHLKSSNVEIAKYLREQPPEQRADPDLMDAISENEEVVQRMEGRIGMIRLEVEKRGMPWPNDEEEASIVKGNGIVNGDLRPESNLGQDRITQGEGAQAGTSETRATSTSAQSGPSQPSGRLTDEELARQLRERMGDPDEDGEGGLHL